MISLSEGDEEEKEENVAMRIVDALSKGCSRDIYTDLTDADRIPDDEFLIRRYQKVITVSNTSEIQTCSSNIDSNESNIRDFKLGQRVTARYKGDGLWYPGKIIAIKNWKRSYLVKFDYYGNEEEVLSAELCRLGHDKKKNGNLKRKRD